MNRWLICGLVRRGGLGSCNDNSRRPRGWNEAQGNFFRRKSNFSRCLYRVKTRLYANLHCPNRICHIVVKKKERIFHLQTFSSREHVTVRCSRHPSRDTHWQTFSLDRATTLRVILYLCITGQWGTLATH